MTSLGVALAVDARGPCALYIITDSRISWSNPGSKKLGIWDGGQKTFASTCSPDIFGFCGDAYFPPMIIHQTLDQMRSGALFNEGTSSEDRHSIFIYLLKNALEQQSNAPMTNFSIFHGARDAEFMESHFRLWEVRALIDDTTKSVTWTDEERTLNEDSSYFAHLDGSGRNYVRRKGREWINTDAQGTSRAAVWSFCNTLHEGLDPYSGGAPQLVGIWRKGLAKSFGFWWKGKPYLFGAEIPVNSPVNNVDWFNHRFERCDGLTGNRKPSAARHAKPVSLPKGFP